MQVQTRQGPAYGVARLSLAPGEQVRVEAGGMMAMSAGVTLSSKMEGGIIKSLKRAALGGESFFVTTYTAPAQGGFVDVAARLPGDLLSYDLVPGASFFIQKGSWLANAQTVTIDAQWGGFKNMFGSEGGFIVRAEGQGHGRVRLLRRAGGLEPRTGPDASPSTPATWSPTSSR